MGYGKKQHRCRRRGCIYHRPAWSDYGCDYAGITGKARLGQLPPDRQRPEDCPLYKRGKKISAMLEPMQMPGSNPKTEVDRARYHGGGKTKYDWERGRELYEAGGTDREIAHELGCAPHTVYEWRQRSGYLPRNIKEAQQ